MKQLDLQIRSGSRVGSSSRRLTTISQTAKWSLVALMLLVVNLAIAQRTITGTVTDAETGETLISANVSEEGTSNGVTTDIDGKYSITVSEGATLVFSYIGYSTQEVELGASNVVDIQMSSGELLDEVVVIGYGTIRKSDLTGSVSSLDGKELTSIAVGNPTSAIQGKVAGVQVENNGGEPGGGANVFVRGVSSLTNSFPLYVIDGTFADNMNYLNPNDIERIEVLKDASAAAIYGSRAANGVVIIQTKRGSENGEPRISLNIRRGIESPDKLLEFMNGDEFVAYRNQRQANDNEPLMLDANALPSTDFQDLSLNNGSIEDYGLSVAGGGANSKYFISGNFYRQDGILISSGYERLNLRANTEFTLGKFKIQQSLGVTRSEIERNVWFGRDGSSTAPIMRAEAPENDGGFEAPDFDVHGFAGQNKYGLASLEDHIETDNKIFGNVNVSYEIMEGLTAKLNMGVDLLNRHNFAFRPTYFMSASDAVDNVNDLNDLTEIRSEDLLTVIEPTLSYGKDIGNGRLDAVVGYTRQKIDFRSVGIYAENLPNNGIQVIGAATPTDVRATLGVNNVSGLISQFGRVNYSHDGKYLFSGTIRRDASSKFAEAYRVGIFPSASIGWNISSEDFWTLNAVNKFKFRAGYGSLGAQNIPDYSYQSVFNLTSGTSFGGAVVPGYAQTSLALEDLKWETANTFNVGFDVGILEDKITFSAEYYNKNVEDVLVGVALPSTIGFSQPVIQNIGTINNSGFELEGVYRQRGGDFTFDLGLNLSTFNSEITSLPNTVVGPTVTEDGVRVNQFLEGQAPGVYYGFVVDGVYADQAAIDSDPNVANDPDRKAIIQPGDFIRKDLNGDGKITGEDQEVLGDPTPDFIYGLNFSGNYKEFDFGVFFQGVQGNEIYNVTRYYNIFWADDNKLSEVSNAWTPTNTNTDIPRATTKDEAQNGAPSSFFVEDGSYFRLRSLEVGYTLNTDNVKWMQNLRFFVSGQNLFTLTSYSGYNPDISSTNGGRAGNSPFFGVPSTVNPLLGRGLDVRAYPNARSFIFGIQAGF
ncbi:MAG: SusC/RagA family TonB-linked outer membrane protein [Saprospiraceae bacterium]